MLDQNTEQKSLAKQIYKTNLFLLKGLKENTEVSFRKACFLIKKQKKQNPVAQIKQAIEIIKPFCETKSIKLKNNITKVPMEITKKRQQLFATRFFLSAVREKKTNFLHEKLSSELIGIIGLTSSSLKICENFQKNVETNKVFIQYRF
jgi:small subunit ribosomal protein S7